MFPHLYEALATIAVAAAAAVPCSLLGCFLLLKRMGMLADAIGHGVLPGIVLAVMFTGRFDPLLMLGGAMVFGFFTAFLSQWLHDTAKVSEDASLGVAFTALFAFGVILVTKFMGNIHLDLDCVTFSVLELVPLDSTKWLGVTVPTALFYPLVVLFLVLGVLLLFWKEFKLATFDPDLARTLGMPVTALHYLLVALTAGTTVASFEAFGSVLVLGMFIVPAATARLLTDRLGSMLAISALAAVTACIVGYLLASPEILGCNATGMIVVVAGGQFGLAWLCAPRHGLIAQASRRFRLVSRIVGEEILATLYRAEESGLVTAPLDLPDHRFPRWIVALARYRLSRQHLLVSNASGPCLTPEGRVSAQSVVRAHRLWETYLEKNFDLPLDHLHAPAAQIEHFLGPEVQTQLADELAEPRRDPHGKEIPGR